jgi:spermidine synthase
LPRPRDAGKYPPTELPESMRKTVILDSVLTPDGGELVLTQRDDLFTIRVDGVDLMSNRSHGSEEELARLGFAVLGACTTPRVLIGGLGMGFTLRAVLDQLTPASGAGVVVAELFPGVIGWNRTWLGPLASHPLDDPRVQIFEGNVGDVLTASPGTYDLVLLDVDNGPNALVVDANHHLYTRRGVQTLHAALRPGGVAAVWSAGHDVQFADRLHRGGFEVEVHQVTARAGGKGDRHVIFLGQKR